MLIKKIKLRYYYICLLFLSLSIATGTKNASHSLDNSFQWQIGEELTYKVKWSFIRLGTLKFQVRDSMFIDGNPVYHIKLFLDTNPLIFFIDMHNVYESLIDKQFRLHLYSAYEEIDGIDYKTEYRFNYNDSLIHFNRKEIKDTTKTIQKEIPFDQRLFDGISMIFYTRANVSSIKRDSLVSFFEDKQGKVSINFRGENGTVKIDALPSPMDTYFVDGRIHIKGIAGVTGPFKGWFAKDSQRIPLKAELQVFIGNIKVELEEWKKWNPIMTESK